MSEYRLVMKGVVKTFPGVKALDHAQLELRPGKVMALMGENGAGKSTLMKCMFGIYKMDEGEIEYEGEKVVIANPLDALGRGIAMVHQELQPIPARTVAENIWLGRYPTKKIGPITIVDHSKMYADTDALLKKLKLQINSHAKLGSLSIAQMQMVEIAKAVSANCKVLILDEPTSSLDEQEVEKLFKLMLDLKSRGVGIIFVTHFLDQVYAVCDKITVLRDGKFEGEYNAADLPKVELVSKMLGNELGMKVTHFTSAESAQERSRIKTQFANADPYQAIVAIKCLDEGVNIPSIKTAFILASSTNPKEYIQRRGRVLRKYKGKKFAVIYDFVTLPTAIDDVQYGSDGSNFDLSLVKREMVRMKEFGEISMNPADTDKLISELSDAYGMDIIDLDEGVYDYE